MRDPRIDRCVVSADEVGRPEPDDRLSSSGVQTGGSGFTNDPGRISGTQKPRLLIVDDDRIIRFVAREHLEASGFEIAEAEDGAQGLEVFERFRPDLVLLDVEMPDLDGFHVCRKIRHNRAGKYVPILIMTGLGDVASIERAYHVGATDFVSKPLNWTVLAHRIRYMLRANETFLTARSQQARLDEAQQHALLGSWEVDLASGSLAGSTTFRTILALSDENSFLDASQALSRVHPADREQLNKLFTETITHRAGFSLEHRIVNPDGSERIVHTQVRVRSEDGDVLGLEGFTQDVTDRRQSEQRIRFLAYRDGLTGLANRDAFKARVQNGIRLARRKNNIVAVLHLDLDHFKRINDTFGQSAGDSLLRTVADNLVDCLRAGDCVSRVTSPEPPMTISRLGGDEFSILLEDLSHPRDAVVLAERVSESVSRPTTIDGHEVVVTTSLGIAIWPDDGDDEDSLLQNAYSATYHAKERGRANFQFYRTALNEDALEQLELEARLRRAIADDKVVAYYQPKLDLTTGRITSCEAVARWEDPERGPVPPSDFIPVAEATGLICDLGESILRQACEQAREWQERGHHEFKVAVNLSPHQLKDEQIVETVTGVLAETRLDPSCLELEITESAIIHDEVRTSVVDLRSTGIRISLDDFGTGYSSLRYLKYFRVQTLKLDQSFVCGIGSNSDDEAIIEAILSIARNLNLRVVAEGIETEEQMQFLKKRGCDEIQGYLISPPLPAEAFEAFLNKYRRQPRFE